MRFPGIKVGQTNTVERVVGYDHTAGSYGISSYEKLLTTPAMVALMMHASKELVDNHLPENFISVGKQAEVTHEHPSVEGAHIRLTVEIIAFDGYHVELSMHAEDESGVVGTGKHVRTIVNQRWLEIKIQRRMSNSLGNMATMN